MRRSEKRIASNSLFARLRRRRRSFAVSFSFSSWAAAAVAAAALWPSWSRVAVVRVVSAVSSESTPLYLRSAYPLWEPQLESPNSGERLHLTAYLERGKLDEARKVARVGPGLYASRVPSYSGFFTIDKRYNSNLFFWFFPSQDENANAPLILWLQGGPGASSLYGLFEEIGPFKVECAASAAAAAADSDDKVEYSLKWNPHSWNLNHSLLFVDSPVGTGYSYTEHKDGYATNHSTVAQHLYVALKQFYKMFPESIDHDLYLAGESYAGKFIPSLANVIHEENGGPSTFYVNLKGIMIGNGFTDPATILSYSEYTYQLGLIGMKAKSEMQKLEAQGRKAIEEKHFIDAFYSWSGILSIFVGESRFSSLYNVLDDRWTWNASTKSYVTYVQRADVRRAIHVGDAEYTSLGVVYYKMIPDFMSDVRPALKTVFDNYRVLLYGGQFDIVCAYPLTARMLETVEFAASAELQRARRRAWYVDGQLAGYARTAANLTEALVRNAGHMVPHDKPEWALHLITKFIRQQLPVE